MSLETNQGIVIPKKLQFAPSRKERMIVKQEICFGQQAAVLATPRVAYLRDVMIIREESPSGAFPVAFGVLE